MNLEYIQIGNISLHTYGFILGLAIVVGIWIAEQVVKKYYQVEYLDKNDVEKSVFWVVIFGVLGARLYHVTDYWSYYSGNLMEILMVWNGGLGIYGAIMGGLLGVGVYVRISNVGKKSKKEDKKKKLFGLLDVLIVGLPFSQAIGRLGNFVNQELYGKPTNVPWAIYIQIKNRVVGYESYEYFHPLFLYEGLWNLGGFFILYVLLRKRILVDGKGNYFTLYLLWYGLGRAILEPMRIRYWSLGGIPVASIIGVSIMALGMYIIYQRRKKHEWSVLAN